MFGGLQMKKNRPTQQTDYNLLSMNSRSDYQPPMAPAGANNPNSVSSSASSMKGNSQYGDDPIPAQTEMRDPFDGLKPSKPADEFQKIPGFEANDEDELAFRQKSRANRGGNLFNNWKSEEKQIVKLKSFIFIRTMSIFI